MYWLNNHCLMIWGEAIYNQRILVLWIESDMIVTTPQLMRFIVKMTIWYIISGSFRNIRGTGSFQCWKTLERFLRFDKFKVISQFIFSNNIIYYAWWWCSRFFKSKQNRMPFRYVLYILMLHIPVWFPTLISASCETQQTWFKVIFCNWKHSLNLSILA